jgi:Saccharopine dehydrogenase NADP binding domain
VTRILIIGGYGAFGARAAERLARDGDLEIVIAGRNRARAEAAAGALAERSKATVRSAVLDATRIDAEQIKDIAPAVIINASGPYQDQDYTVARAAIAAGCHYVDLADARAFVTGITELNAEATAAGLLVVSGASSVPALSSAVVDHNASEFSVMRRVETCISPGNSFDPGEATLASVLGGIGKPIHMTENGSAHVVYGWQGLTRRHFPILGERYVSHVDVPDLELFPQRYPTLKTVLFRAGLEVSVFHLGLWFLSWLVRAGVFADAAPCARPLLALKKRLAFLGSDQGGMSVVMDGMGPNEMPLRVSWSLIARQGHGPYIPAIGAVVLARRLARGEEERRGAMACLGLVTVPEFLEEVRDLAITSVLLREEGPQAEDSNRDGKDAPIGSSRRGRAARQAQSVQSRGER